MGLALIAGFGVFGGSLLGGHLDQARILSELPISPRVAGWLVYAVPVAGLFGLILPIRSRIVRALAILLLIPGLLAAVVMSKPRGMSTADWEAALGSGGSAHAAFVQAAGATALALLAALVLWAVALTRHARDDRPLRRPARPRPA